MPYTTQWSLLASIDLDALRSNHPAEWFEPYHAGQGAFLESDFPGVTFEYNEYLGPYVNAKSVPEFDAVRAVFCVSDFSALSYLNRNGAIDFWGASGLYHDFGSHTTGAVWPADLVRPPGELWEVVELECYLSRSDRPGMARLRRPRLGDDWWEQTVTWSHDEWFAGVPFDLEMPLYMHGDWGAFTSIASLYINAASTTGPQKFWTDFRHSVEVV